MTSPRIVVFDLDGTLVDTAPDLISALNYVLDREGLPPVPLKSARNMIGAGARKLIERGLESRAATSAQDELARMTADFIDYYADHIADASRPFEGLEAALDELEQSGFRFAVCTNKLEWLSKRLLDQLGLSPRFAAICGADTFGVSKPDPVILQQTVARAGGDIGATIMVGDAGPDIGVARRAGDARDRGRVRLHRRADRRTEARPADRPYGDLPAAVESLSKVASGHNIVVFVDAVRSRTRLLRHLRDAQTAGHGSGPGDPQSRCCLPGDDHHRAQPGVRGTPAAAPPPNAKPRAEEAPPQRQPCPPRSPPAR